jgi:hypothetical protein
MVRSRACLNVSWRRSETFRDFILFLFALGIPVGLAKSKPRNSRKKGQKAQKGEMKKVGA